MLLKEFVYSFDLNRRQLGEIIYILVNTKLENSLYYSKDTEHEIRQKAKAVFDGNFPLPIPRVCNSAD